MISSIFSNMGFEKDNTDNLISQNKELKEALEKERAKNLKLMNEISELKHYNVKIMASAEAEEDFITNKLTKKLELLRAEKNELLATVELEEEYLTNNLQKKLNQVISEKSNVEKELEKERGNILKISKQLDDVLAEKRYLEQVLNDDLGPKHDLVMMRLEIERYKQQIKDSQEEKEKFELKKEKLKSELRALKGDNFVLSQRISKENDKMKEILKDNLLMSTEYEIEDERQFNTERLQKGENIAIAEAKRRRLRSVSLPPTKHEIQDRSLGSPRLSNYRALKESAIGYKSKDDDSFEQIQVVLFDYGLLTGIDSENYNSLEPLTKFSLSMDTVITIDLIEGTIIVLKTKNGRHFMKFSDTDESNEWLSLLNSLTPYNN